MILREDDPTFVERPFEMAALRRALIEKRSTVQLLGVGGVGKSWIAHRFAQVFRGTFQAVWRSSAQSPEGFQ